MALFEKIFGKRERSSNPREINDENFEQEVLAPELPAVVEFWSARCPHCQVMTGLLNEISPMYTGRINIFRLKVEENPQAAIQYQIQGTPTLVFFKNHRPVERITGLIALNPLREKLNSLQ